MKPLNKKKKISALFGLFVVERYEAPCVLIFPLSCILISLIIENLPNARDCVSYKDE